MPFYIATIIDIEVELYTRPEDPSVLMCCVRRGELEDLSDLLIPRRPAPNGCRLRFSHSKFSCDHAEQLDLVIRTQAIRAPYDAGVSSNTVYSGPQPGISVHIATRRSHVVELIAVRQCSMICFVGSFCFPRSAFLMK